MPTTTETLFAPFTRGGFEDVATPLLDAAVQATSASTEVYLSGIDTVADLQRQLVQGTPLEPFAGVISTQTQLARTLLESYFSVGGQLTRSATDSVRHAGRSGAELTESVATQTTQAAGQAATQATQAAGRTATQATQAAGRTATQAARQTARSANQAAQAPRKRAEGDAREEAPIADYDSLTADEVIAKLPELSQSVLNRVRSYEKAHQSRSTVLERVDALRGREPAPGYDEMTVEEVQKLLAEGDGDLATRVRDYERRHKRRASVLQAAERASS